MAEYCTCANCKCDVNMETGVYRDEDKLRCCKCECEVVEEE